MFSKIHHILNNQYQKHIESNQVQLQINNMLYPFNQKNFTILQSPQNEPTKRIYIDGGQAILANGATFALSFIRIAALTQYQQPSVKPTLDLREFFLLTIPKWNKDQFYFENHIFEHQNTTQISTPSCNIDHLQLQTIEKTITPGTIQAAPTKIIDIARRFAELQLAVDLQKIDNDQNTQYILDGTLTPTYPQESTYLEKLSKNTCAIAKSSTLLTTSNQSINSFLKLQGPIKPWIYMINDNVHFVKLHEKSNHIFRAEGDNKNISLLLSQCKDAIFPGYPYGLIRVDQIARVTNEEKRILTTKFLNHKNNIAIKELLSTQNSHSILDNIR